MNVHPVRKVVGDSDKYLGKRTIRLDSGTACPFIDHCRIVLFKKQLDFQLVDVGLLTKSEDCAVIKPFH